MCVYIHMCAYMYVFYKHMLFGFHNVLGDLSSCNVFILATFIKK